MNEFFEKEGLDWSRSKAVTTDGVAAMQGSQKGVIKKIQELSSNCIRIHCILYRKALVTKKLKLNADKAGGQQNKLSNVL